MSREVDTRVVEMRFDNAQFEKGVQQTNESLSKLKNSLKFEDSAKSVQTLNNAMKNIDTSPLDKAVDVIGVKLSALEVAKNRFIENLVDDVQGRIKKLVDNTLGFVTNGIIEGGKRRAQNLEDAKFQLEGLGIAWESIEDDINYGVLDTAYGLDAAAKAAAQLSASGIQVGDSMKTALRGISGVAAMTNSTYEDISRIYITVAGNGRLMGDQLLQLSTRGINAAATIAKHFGITEAELRELVSDGEVSFKMFADAMDSAFGEHAKDANKTFQGAMSNLRAALARIGAEIATPLMKNATDIFNALRPLVNAIKAELMPDITAFAEKMSVLTEKLVGKINGALPAVKDFLAKIKALVGFLKPSEKAMIGLQKILTPVFKVLKEVLSFVAKAAVFTILAIKHVIDGILSFIGSGEKLIDFVKRLVGEERWNKFMQSLSDAIANLKEQLAKLKPVFLAIFEKIAGSEVFQRALGGIVVLVEKLAIAISDGLTWALEKLSKFDLSNIIDNLTKLFSGKISFLDFIKNLKITEAFSSIGKFIIEGFVNGVENTSGGIFGVIKSLAQGVIDTFCKILGIASPSKVFFTIGGFIIAGLVAGILSGIPAVQTALGPVFASISESLHLEDFGERLHNFLQPLKEFVSTLNLGEIALVSFAGAISYLLIKIGGAIKSLSEVNKSIAAGITKVTDSIAGGIDRISNSISYTISSIGKGIEGLVQHFSELDAIEKRKATAAVIFGIAAAIAALGASLYLLSKVPAEDLKNTTLWFGGFTVVLLTFVGVLGVLQKLGKMDFATISTGMTKLGLSFLEISGAFYLFAKSLTLLGGMGEEQAGRAVGVILLFGSILVTLGVLCKLGKAIDAEISAFGTFLLKLSGVIALIAGPIILLGAANQLSPGLVWEGYAVLAAIVGLFGVLLAFLSDPHIIAMESEMDTWAKMLIKLALVLNLMTTPILLLGAANKLSPGLVWEGYAVIAALTGLFMGIAAFFKIPIFDELTDIDPFIKSMAKLALALNLMVGPVLLLGGAQKLSPGIVWEGFAIIAALTALFMGVAAFFEIPAFQNIDKNINAFSNAMLKFSAAVNLLAFPIILLGAIPPGIVWKGAAVIGALLTVMTLLSLLVTIGTGEIAEKISEFGSCMMKFGVAINLLMLPIILLGAIDAGTVWKGIACVSALLTLMSLLALVVSLALPMEKGLTKFGILMIMLSGSIAIIGTTVALMSLVPNIDKAIDTTWALTGLVAAMAYLLKMMNQAELETKTIVAFGVAIGSLVLILPTIALIGHFGTDLTAVPPILLSLGAVAGAMALTMIALNKCDISTKTIVAFGVSMLAIAAIMPAIGSMALMGTNLEAVPPIMLTIAAVAGAMSLLMIALDKCNISLKTLAVFGGAMLSLLAIIPVISKLGELKGDWTPLLQLAAILGGLLAIFALAGALSTPMLIGAAAMAAVAASLAILGSALNNIANAASVFMTLMATLSQFGPAARQAADDLVYLVTELINVVPNAITSIAKGIQNGASSLAAALSTLITSMVDTLSANGIKISETIATILTNVLTSLVQNGPAIKEVVLNLLDTLLTAVQESVPKVMSIIGLLIEGVCNLLIQYAPVVGNTLMEAINGLINAIASRIPDVINAGVNLIIAFLQGLGEAIPLIVMAAIDMIVTLIDGLGTAIDVEHERLTAACEHIVYSITNVLGSLLGDFVELGKAAIDGFIDGMQGTNDYTEARNAGEELGNAALEGTAKALDSHSPSKKYNKLGQNIDEGLEEGIKAKAYTVRDRAVELGNKALDGTKEVLPKVAETGKAMASKVGEGMENGTPDLIEKGKDVISKVGEKVSDVAGNVFGSAGGNGANSLVNEFLSVINARAPEMSKAIIPGINAMPWDNPDFNPTTKYDAGTEDAKKAYQELLEKLKGKKNKGGGGGGSTKATEKSIEELAQTYRFGADCVDAFASKHQKAIEAIDATADSTKVAKTAIEELGIKLYQGTDQYIQDLNNAQLKSEDVFKHIQESFNAVYNGIRDSLANLDPFSEYEEPEWGDMFDTTNNLSDWNEAVDEFNKEMEQFQNLDGLSEDTKQYFIKQGWNARDIIHQAVEASEEDLDEFDYQFNRWFENIDAVTANQMGVMAERFGTIEGYVRDSTNQIGEDFTIGFVNAINPLAGMPNATALANNSLEAMKLALDSHSPSKKTMLIGGDFAEGFRLGVLQYSTQIYDAGKSIASRMCEGLRMGLMEGKSGVIAEAVSVAVAAYEAACDALDIESPSKKFAWVGEMLDAGFAKGIERNADKPIDEINNLIQTIYDDVDSELDGDFLIKPILDLSDVRAKAGSIGSMLEGQRVAAFGIQNGSGLPQNGASYNFVQNNYSPKALSRIDIYRQTKNQFSMLKGV